MWTRRKTFPTKKAPDCGARPSIVTPTFLEQAGSSQEFTVEESDYNFVATLGYTLIPEINHNEATELLQWVLARWVQDKGSLVSVLEERDVLLTLTQIEYFFAGTDNGQLLVIPLLPPHFLHALVKHVGQSPSWASLARAVQREGSSHAADGDGHGSARLPYHCGPRRLLHQHAREEPVIALDHLGTLVVSANADGYVALSVFHPVVSGVVAIDHGNSVRCLKLWEGNCFVDRVRSGEHDTEPWRVSLGNSERAAVYLFTGDEHSVVRLWRIDVLQRSYCLMHVLVCTPNQVGLRSSLDVLMREDRVKETTCRESSSPIYCLAVDSEKRLLAGTEGGVFVWCLDRLTWHSNSNSNSASSHPLCWDDERHTPMGPCVAENPDWSSSECQAAKRRVRLRAARLVNQHVWWRGEEDVAREQLSGHEGSSTARTISKWKPKYAKVLRGRGVSVVSNEVALPGESPSDASLEDLLAAGVATLSFDEAQLRNDIHVPLACLAPVVYPLTYLPMRGNACFALQVLADSGRLLTSGSDGKTGLWMWSAEEEQYLPALVTSGHPGAQRGLGRQLCVLRSPDVFITCGYDDGIVKEWHVYDEEVGGVATSSHAARPDSLLVRCERRFTVKMDDTPGGGDGGEALGQLADLLGKQKHTTSEAEAGNVAGVCAAVAFPAFQALFVVGVFDSMIHAYSLSEVIGCEAPREFIYNGYKTVRLPFSLQEEEYRLLGE